VASTHRCSANQFLQIFVDGKTANYRELQRGFFDFFFIALAKEENLPPARLSLTRQVISDALMELMIYEKAFIFCGFSVPNARN
jgi:hypothetical protein